MSAERITYSLLSGSSAVTAIVGQRIYPMSLPEGQPLPCVVYDVVGQFERQTLTGNEATRLITAQVRVTAVASANAYASLVPLFNATKSAMRLVNGTAAGINNVLSLITSQGQDLFDNERQLCIRTVDVKLMFNEPA
jgi:hypothetical protein